MCEQRTQDLAFFLNSAPLKSSSMFHSMNRKSGPIPDPALNSAIRQRNSKHCSSGITRTLCLFTSLLPYTKTQFHHFTTTVSIPIYPSFPPHSSLCVHRNGRHFLNSLETDGEIYVLVFAFGTSRR